MNEEVRSIILELFDEAYDAFKDEDSKKLKDISDYTLHHAGVFQDKDSITFSVAIYALAKVSELEREKDYPGWKEFKDRTLALLKEARKNLGKGDNKAYERNLKQLFIMIGKLDKKLTRYATEAIQHARIKKGSKVYEHGLSAGLVAELMGISEWELQSYVGQTALSEKIVPTREVGERIMKAKRLFHIK